jgi:hypothetical protein
MAHRIQAVNAYRPRIEQGTTVQKPELLRSASRSTSLVEGTIDMSIKELRDQILEYCRAGRAVKVEGLGIWAPAIGLDGKLSIHYRPDPTFGYGLNLPGVFSGKILNRENIGKTPDELITMWNEANPTDFVPVG